MAAVGFGSSNDVLAVSFRSACVARKSQWAVGICDDIGDLLLFRGPGQAAMDQVQTDKVIELWKLCNGASIRTA